MKIAINKCYGGFGLSDKATEAFLALKDTEFTRTAGSYFYASNGEYIYLPDLFESRIAFRTDPDLIAIIEAMGEDAWGECAELSVIEIPDGVAVTVQEYDGQEWVAEVHRTWD